MGDFSRKRRMERGGEGCVLSLFTEWNSEVNALFRISIESKKGLLEGLPESRHLGKKNATITVENEMRE